MNIWKLSIKTNTTMGYKETLEKCIDKGIVCVGWHHGYLDNYTTPRNSNNIF